MPEEKRKLNAWIPVSLYSKLENAGYDNITQALIKALEKFFEDPHEDITGYGQDIEGYKQNIEILKKDIEGYSKDLERIQEGHKQDITGYKENIKSLNSEIERLQAVIMGAPDPLELARLQERNEGLKLLIEEKEKRIQELTQYKEDIGAFANYFKNIEVKQIEAPGEKKKWWKFW
jgi:DNA repair exonuclease SbcCD ATPase subunit